MTLTRETLASERPPQQCDRYSNWYDKALARGIVQMGPRFASDFDAIFARQYEAEQIADSAKNIKE